MTPILRWLKRRFKNADVDVLLKNQFASLLQKHPDANQVIAVDLQGWKQLLHLRQYLRGRQYDAVVDLQAKLVSRWLARSIGAKYIGLYQPQRWARFWLVKFGINIYREIQPIPLRYLKAVEKWGVKDDARGAMLYPCEKDCIAVPQTDGDKNSKGWIALSPGASRYTKRWPVSYFKVVARHFQKAGFDIVLIGGISDQEICREILKNLEPNAVDLSGKLQLMETSACLKQAKLVVTNDTGVMHMAGAVDTPLVAIFGPTTHHLGFFPFRSKSRIVEHSNLSCRPCSFHGTEKCPKRHFRCMREISPEQVIQAAEQLLSE